MRVALLPSMSTDQCRLKFYSLGVLQYKGHMCLVLLKQHIAFEALAKAFSHYIYIHNFHE